ncbi:MAG: hypothetical protein ATN36_08120 [Epulopiscium sp. Nele67-Bin005]|nr:MAG: hypothetical protein ATN36_08120 [Epulopiscium sp. Nele67-Bin005]
MKIVLLLANCSHNVLYQMQETIINVLTELELEIKPVHLETLPYFNGRTSLEMDNILRDISESKGVIALCNIHLIGMHSAMQTFFDYLSVYPDAIVGKSLLTITYSDLWGEGEAAYQISRGWKFLGGSDIGTIAFNSHSGVEEEISVLEKQMFTSNNTDMAEACCIDAAFVRSCVPKPLKKKGRKKNCLYTLTHR